MNLTRLSQLSHDFNNWDMNLFVAGNALQTRAYLGAGPECLETWGGWS